MQADTHATDPIASTLEGHVARLAEHPLYARLDDEDCLRTFMRAHVFAVWDFQCLLKALQRRLTCVEVPWLPTADPEARRMINEIVLDEESDLAPDGSHLSHYELYLVAMEAAGADASPVRAFLADLERGASIEQALARPELPPGVAAFVGTTLRIATSDKVHEIAAAFTYGREEVIPTMFRRVVARLAELEPDRWSAFQYYLERHIDLDGGEHGPLARRLVTNLCAGDPTRIAEARAIAAEVLDARAALWGAVLASLPTVGAGVR